jgi:xanthine dehydrogenase molybdopterin-binding subunit B
MQPYNFSVILQIAGAGAKKSGRPVRCVLSRREDMALTGQRHEVLVDYDVQVTISTISSGIEKLHQKVIDNTFFLIIMDTIIKF